MSSEQTTKLYCALDNSELINSFGNITDFATLDGNPPEFDYQPTSMYCRTCRSYYVGSLPTLKLVPFNRKEFKKIWEGNDIAIFAITIREQDSMARMTDLNF